MATSRRAPVRSADLLDPPNTTLALTLIGIAGLVGALIWGGIAYGANVELGWIAWGIGALVGFACIKGGGHGTGLAVASGAVALLSIVAGKWFAIDLILPNAARESLVASGAKDAYTSKVELSAAWKALGETPTEDEFDAFAVEFGIDVADAAEFRTTVLPELVKLEEHGSFDAWLDAKVSAFVDEAPRTEALKNSFEFLDIIFLLLGVGTAFGMVAKHTEDLKLARRQELRALRDEEEAAAAEDAVEEPAD